MQIGDTISFGNYKWRALDIQKNAALILTEYIIEECPYHDKYVGITWADCSLRKYLNGEFYDKFSETDKRRTQEQAPGFFVGEEIYYTGVVHTQMQRSLKTVLVVAIFPEQGSGVWTTPSNQK